MKLTKYEHACFVIKKDGKSVVVDPGELSIDFMVPNKVVAIVVTHEHPDHFDTSHIDDILEENPNAVIIGPPDVTAKLTGYETRTARTGENFIIEGIEFEFFGAKHAVIYPDLPVAQNVGVLIDERVYYPGDSFTVPDKSVDTLALPLSGPWHKLSEALDFLVAVAPRHVFPTHDSLLSKDGQGFSDAHVQRVAKEHDIDFERIDGKTIEID